MRILIFILVLSLQAIACEISNKTLTDSFDGKEFNVELTEYNPKASKTSKSHQVIVLPPISGANRIDRRYSLRTCLRGVNTILITKWTDDMEQSIEDLGVHYRGTLRGLKAIEVVLSYSNKPTRLLGTSLGGIYAGVAAGKFDQIKKVAIIASGTNLSEIMATSTLPDMQKLKQARFDYFGFQTDEEYAAAIKALLPLEASDFSQNLTDKELLMVQTNGDSVIRPTYQKQLKALFDAANVQTIHSRLGHRNGIIWAGYRRTNNIVNFLSH